MNIYLIGFRKSGKKTVGRLLADRFGFGFVDMNAHIVAAEGRPLSRIITEDGAKALRILEKNLLETLSRREDTVVSTSEAVVIDPVNIERLKASGRTVWLKATVELICRRIAVDMARKDVPATRIEVDLSQKIEKALNTLTPRYRLACDLELEIDGIDPETLATRIMGELG